MSAARRRYLDRPVVDELATLETSYIDHLAADLLGDRQAPGPGSWVRGDDYRAADAFAKTCLQIALYVDGIYGGKIEGWTQSALNAFNAVLLHYIQQVRGETLRIPVTNLGQERTIYAHLEGCSATLAQVGDRFHKIYKERNRFTHVLQLTENGQVRTITMGPKRYKRAKYRILGLFRDALMEFNEVLAAEAAARTPQNATS